MPGKRKVSRLRINLRHGWIRYLYCSKEFHHTVAVGFAQLIEFAKQNGGIEYAEKRMFELADDAKALLSVFPDSEIKSALLLYVDYVARRTL